MLFVLDSEGVPAIARWVRVGSTWTSTDATPPDAISGIQAEFVSTNTIIYSWPGTGDDGMTGVASQYDLRYRATTAMNSGNFASCPVAPNVPAPACPNGTQPYSLTGLQACTKYWIGMKVGDEKNNLSGLSIYGWIKTACSGGGGGFSASEATGVEGGGGGAASAGTRLRFGSTPTAALPGGTTTRLVAEFGDGTTPAWTLRRVSTSDDRSMRGLDVGLVVVQDSDGAGGWRTRSGFVPGAGSLGVRSLARAGRIVFPAATEFDALEIDPLRFTLAGATHSRLGDLVAASSLATAPELADGESITLQYSPRATEGTGQDCFFTVRSVAEAAVVHARETKLAEPATKSPSEFALRVPRPNPFSNATRIPFALGSGASARLEIFDACGRRVRVLASEWREAGEHETSWDGRDADGTRVRPGIYVVRLIAGAERAERKLALLP
jgi:hypothetical protein